MNITVTIFYSAKNYLKITGNYTPGKPAMYLDPPEGSDFEVKEILFVNKETGATFNIDDLPEDIICEEAMNQYLIDAHDDADEAYYASQENA